MDTNQQQQPQRTSWLDTAGFYLVATIATGVSADTSWNFFKDVLHIKNDFERGILFGIVELTLVACGLAMRGAAKRGQRPGPARLLAWALCGAAAYMAYAEAGPVAGTARIILGPVLAVIALHIALGVTIRAARGESTGTMAKVRGEIRERALSRLGLGDDTRDAIERTRDRAADRAARLATAKRAPFKRTRLARAVRASGAATDPARRDRVLDGVAAYKHLGDLSNADLPSPWRVATNQKIRNTQHTSSAQVATNTGADHEGGTGTPTTTAPAGTAPNGRQGTDDTGTHMAGTGTPKVDRAPVPGTPGPAGTGTPVEPAPVPRARIAAKVPATRYRTDAELLAALANVERNPDGTVPVKRAAAALGCGPDRARKLLDQAGLRTPHINGVAILGDHTE